MTHWAPSISRYLQAHNWRSRVSTQYERNIEKPYAVLAQTDPKLVRLYNPLVTTFFENFQFMGSWGSSRPSKVTMWFDGATTSALLDRVGTTDDFSVAADIIAILKEARPDCYNTVRISTERWKPQACFAESTETRRRMSNRASVRKPKALPDLASAPFAFIHSHLPLYIRHRWFRPIQANLRKYEQAFLTKQASHRRS